MTQMINQFAQEDKYGTDYEFFAQVVVTHIQNNALVHDEFFGGVPFPTPRENYQFVGQVFNENEETIAEHIAALRAHSK